MWAEFRSSLVGSAMEIFRDFGLTSVRDHELLKCVTVKASDDADLVISLLNPVYHCLYSKLDEIGERIIEASQKWTLPLKSYKIIDIRSGASSLISKSLAFYFNQESALPVLLEESFLKLDQNSLKSCLILNVTRPRNEDWSYLRSKCFAEAFQKLNQLKYEQVDLKSGDIKQLVGNEVAKETHIPDDCLKELNIESETSKVYLYFTLISSVISLNSYDQVYLISEPSDENPYKQAFKAYQSMKSLTNADTKLHFISLAPVKSEYSQKDFIHKMGLIIREQSISNGNCEYSETAMKKVIEFVLRYSLLSVASKKVCKVDFAKLKEAIFIQYNHARLCGILSKFHQDYGSLAKDPGDIQLLKNPAEWNLIKYCFLQTSSILQELGENSFVDIHQVTVLLTKITNKISVFYNSVRIIVEVNDKTLPLIQSRLLLIEKIRNLLRDLVARIDCSVVSFM